MHDYKNNLFKPQVEPKDRLEETILLDLLPDKDLNRPSYSVATVSRVMSSYIRALRHIVKREWKFDVLNLYEPMFPLFVDFYECVVANELGVRKENIEWDCLWHKDVAELWCKLTFKVRGDDIFINGYYDSPDIIEASYIESNFMMAVRRLSYYFQAPESIPVVLLRDLEQDINLGSIFSQWMAVSDDPKAIPDRSIEFSEQGYALVLDFTVGTSFAPLETLKERLKDGTFNYDSYTCPKRAIGELPPEMSL